MSASPSPALHAFRGARLSTRPVPQPFVRAAPSVRLVQGCHRSNLRTFRTSPSFGGGIAAAWPRLPRQNEWKTRKAREDSAYEHTPSSRVSTRDMFAKGDIPGDIGLLPSTLVLGQRTLRGSKTTSYLSLLRKLAVKRTREFLSLLYLKFQQGKRFKLELGSRKKTAEELHRKLFTAYAENDKVTISALAVSGMRDSMSGHMLSRTSGLRYRWTLHNYTASSKVMSDRMTMLPGYDDDDAPQNWLRQTIVRIKSKQSLQPQGKGRQWAKEGARELERDMTDYVVLQRRIINGKEEPWKFWGTTTETSARDVERFALDTAGTRRQ